jgi:predicted transcriptional regulator
MTKDVKRRADPSRIEEVKTMSVTITIPADLEQRIAGVAAAQGKNVEQIAIEALEMIFEPAEELEDARTLRALKSARRGEGRPAKEVLEEIRLMLGIPVDAKGPAR